MKRFSKIILGIVLMASLCSMPAKNVQAAPKNVVVVIDPGHGGENLGTDYLPIPEKTYTLVIANYMKEELEKYQGVTVVMTRTSDVDLSLEQRAQVAQDVKADLLCSLHLNMSISHILYGSEVWVPSQGNLYAKGYSVGNEFINQFTGMGLFNRGIKTKVGSKGKDYYGVIRACSARNIPGIIVEHCHVDHPIDAKYYSSQEYLKQLGVADATAVAKYFGLKSSTLNVDYSTYAPLAVPIPKSTVFQDTTAPEISSISLIRVDKVANKAVINLTAADSNGKIQSYRYSIDGGVTWSNLLPWSSTGNTMEISVPINLLYQNTIIFESFNQYDSRKASNVITLP